MIYEFEPLTAEEKEKMLAAPALIAILIAGADDKIDTHELNRAVELVNIKTFSEKQDLQPYYRQISGNIEHEINSAVKALPAGAEKRNAEITNRLAELNDILARVKPKFANDLYKSWKNFAHSVARSWGGVMGINSISLHEKQWMDLPMIHEPALHND